MRHKESNEFDSFDKVMDGLLAVPYAELQKKIEGEKRAKAQKKKRATSSPASRASSSGKKRVA